MLEEKDKNKDWLLEELKRIRVRNISSTASTTQILQNCPAKAIKHIYSTLHDDDSAIGEVKTKVETRHWFFTDIISSSDPRLVTKSQIRKINLLQHFIRSTAVFKEFGSGSFVLPTGDGVAIGFPDSPEIPIRMAIQLHQTLNQYNKNKPSKDKIYVRIGIDTGPVYFIKDVLGNNTVWGPGIITSRRLMDICEQNHILTSEKIGGEMSKLTNEYRSIIHPIGDYGLKHGETQFVYSIYGKEFGNKTPPAKNKIDEGDDLTKAKFVFDRIEVYLDVKDAKSMLTNHTWVWVLRSIVKEPIDRVNYTVQGDVPRDFPDLNLLVKSDRNKKLRIASLENEPKRKRFVVMLSKPLKWNQKVKLILNYDWEEPDRYFAHDFATKCRKFKYVLTIPKEGAKIDKIRVLDENPLLNLKTHAKPSPVIKFLKDKIEVIWESSDQQVMDVGRCLTLDWGKR